MVRNGKNGAKQLALIVDDDPDLLKSMVAQLTGMNFEVLDALHYDAAVLHLSSRQPHLVCLDVDLPRQSGYELCEYIRGPLGLMRVPILMMCESGYPEDMAGLAAYLASSDAAFMTGQGVAMNGGKVLIP